MRSVTPRLNWPWLALALMVPVLAPQTAVAKLLTRTLDDFHLLTTNAATNIEASAKHAVFGHFNDILVAQYASLTVNDKRLKTVRRYTCVSLTVDQIAGLMQCEQPGAEDPLIFDY